ncbi:MAG: tetratricopeptide repeat protein [Gaiellaceae bacterium MAG52_C11]|nr:tetratricopeptide repeat protein [Candidatus Gaiellasilicea maunaloa]
MLRLHEVMELDGSERLRRRALAFVGLFLFLGGLAAALGLGALVLDAAVLLLALVALAALGLAFRRVPASAWSRRGLGWIGLADRALQTRVGALDLPRRLGELDRRAGASLGIGGARARRVGTAAGTIALRRAKVGLQRESRLSARAVRDLRASARTTLEARAETLAKRTARSPAPRARRGRDQAMRLNTLGAQLRREGEHERAAEQHRAALAIVRDLGDEHHEALTLNNLALAVVHTDGIEAAVEHFEEALTVLRALGDEEHEGRVIANLGFIHRSHGRSEEAEPLLHAALDKLPADSTAYRRVEEQLRRAS